MSKVQLVKGTAFELQPDKQYLLIFDHKTISADEVGELMQLMGKEGFKGIGVMVNGDPNSVKVIEQEQPHAN